MIARFALVKKVWSMAAVGAKWLREGAGRNFETRFVFNGARKKAIAAELLFALLLTAMALGRPLNSVAGNGVESSDSDDPAVAAELSARQVIEDPENEDAWAALARAQIAQDDLKRAEKTLKDWRAKVSSPKPAIERIEGELAEEEDDAPRAIKAFKRYLQKAPKDDDAWRLLASAYEKAKDWGNAVDAMGRALAITASATGFVHRATMRMHQHDWAGAESDIRQANRMDATDAEMQELFPIFERSATWLPKLIDLDQRVQKSPHDFQCYLDRAEWLRWTGFKDVARDDIEAAFRMNPKSLRARFWFGLIQELPAKDEEEGKPKEATANRANEASHEGVMPMLTALITPDFARELKAVDGVSDPETRAQFLLKYQQPFMALHEVQDVDGSPARAQALLDLDRLPQAGRAARRATELHPDSAPAWLALARWELDTGNYREAMDAARRSAKARKTPEAEKLLKLAQQRLGKR